MVECTLSITHCLRLNLQLHTVDLVRTCRISSFCTVAWQLARFQLTRRIARSLGDSGASCTSSVELVRRERGLTTRHCGRRHCAAVRVRRSPALHCSTATTCPHGRPQMSSADPSPWKKGGKFKKRKRAKKSSFLNISRAIKLRTALC